MYLAVYKDWLRGGGGGGRRRRSGENSSFSHNIFIIIYIWVFFGDLHKTCQSVINTLHICIFTYILLLGIYVAVMVSRGHPHTIHHPDHRCISKLTKYQSINWINATLWCWRGFLHDQFVHPRILILPVWYVLQRCPSDVCLSLFEVLTQSRDGGWPVDNRIILILPVRTENLKK